MLTTGVGNRGASIIVLVRGKLQWRPGCCRQQRGVGAMTKLDQLYVEKSKKFAEICELVACELGYRELATINPEDRQHVEREAEQQVIEWEETTELRTRSNIRPITPSRHLFSEYQNICE